VAGELSLPTLAQRYRLDATGATTGAGQIEASSTRVQGSLGGMKTAVSGAVGAFAAFEGLKFAEHVVGEAEKTDQAVQTTISLFGSAGDAVVEFANNAASNLGLSKAAALGMADGVGTMLRGFGLAGPAAADMSQQLIKVAVDVAAFKNQDPSAVLQGFQRGLTGAARGLKQYGIDTSTAAQHEVALKLGIEGTAASWTAAQKAAVFYQLILKGTSQETGTFAQRSNQLTEEQRIFSAELANTKDEIGQGLLPAATTLFGAFDAGFKLIGPEGEKFLGILTAAGTLGAVTSVAIIGVGKAVTGITTALTASSRAAAVQQAELDATTASLEEQATAAEANAIALRAEATAAASAIVPGTGVLTTSQAAAVALDEEAGAAEVAAAALRQQAIASGAAEAESVGLLASMGPLGIAAAVVGVAIAGLTAVTGLFKSGNQDAGKSTNDLIDQMLQEGQTADSVANTLTSNYIADHHDLIDIMKTVGVSVEDVSSAINGNSQSYDKIKQKVDDYQKSLLKQAEAQDKTLAAYYANGTITVKAGVDTDKLTKAIDTNRKSLQERSQHANDATTAIGELATADQNAANQEDRLATKVANTTETMINRLDQLRAQKEGLDGVLASSIQLQQATFDIADKEAAYQKLLKDPKASAEDRAKALLDLNLAQVQFNQNTSQGVGNAEKWADSVSHMSDAQKKLDQTQKDYKAGKATFADVTAASDAYNASVAKQITSLQAAAAMVSGPLHDAILGEVSDLEKQSGTVGASIVASQKSATARQKEIEKYQALASQLSGPQRDAVQSYIDYLERIPADTVTKTHVEDKDARIALSNYLTFLNGTPPDKTTRVHADAASATRVIHGYRGELNGIAVEKHTTFSINDYDALHTLAHLKTAILSINPNIPVPNIARVEGARGAASGGPRPAGSVTQVGELGPELVTALPGGGIFVTTNADLMAGHVPTQATQGLHGVSTSGDYYDQRQYDLDFNGMGSHMTRRELIRAMQEAERHGDSGAGVPRTVRE
jgi:hypothetical protein